MTEDKEEILNHFREKIINRIKKMDATELVNFMGFGPFISGHSGEYEEDGLPEYVAVCPQYGADWSIFYKKVKND